MLMADSARAPLIMALPLLHAAGDLSFGLLLGDRRRGRRVHAPVRSLAARHPP